MKIARQFSFLIQNSQSYINLIIKKKQILSSMNIDLNTFEEAKVKLVFIGERGVGKTSLINRLTTGEYTNNDRTYGVEVTNRFMHISQKDKTLLVNASYWDYGYVKGFSNAIDKQIRDANIALVCFDLQNDATFEEVPKWVDQVKKANKDIKIILIGNKSDHYFREITKEQGFSLAKKLGIQYTEVSSLTGENIEKLESSLQLLVSESFRITQNKQLLQCQSKPGCA
ncbi:hypothetical protein pb186bvf_002694 [Paramecium bursaria]